MHARKSVNAVFFLHSGMHCAQYFIFTCLMFFGVLEAFVTQKTIFYAIFWLTEIVERAAAKLLPPIVLRPPLFLVCFHNFAYKIISN